MGVRMTILQLRKKTGARLSGRHCSVNAAICYLLAAPLWLPDAALGRAGDCGSGGDVHAGDGFAGGLFVGVV